MPAARGGANPIRYIFDGSFQSHHKGGTRLLPLQATAREQKPASPSILIKSASATNAHYLLTIRRSRSVEHSTTTRSSRSRHRRFAKISKGPDVNVTFKAGDQVTREVHVPWIYRRKRLFRAHKRQHTAERSQMTSRGLVRTPQTSLGRAERHLPVSN